MKMEMLLKGNLVCEDGFRNYYPHLIKVIKENNLLKLGSDLYYIPIACTINFFINHYSLKLLESISTVITVNWMLGSYSSFQKLLKHIITFHSVKFNSYFNTSPLYSSPFYKTLSLTRCKVSPSLKVPIGGGFTPQFRGLNWTNLSWCLIPNNVPNIAALKISAFEIVNDFQLQNGSRERASPAVEVNSFVISLETLVFGLNVKSYKSSGKFWENVFIVLTGGVNPWWGWWIWGFWVV